MPYEGIMFLGVACIFLSSITYITLTTPEERRTEAIGILGVRWFYRIFLIGPMIGDMVLRPAARCTRVGITFGWDRSVSSPRCRCCFYAVAARQRQGRSLSLIQFVKTCKKYWPGSIVFINIALGSSMTVPLHLLKKFVLDNNLSGPMIGELGFITVFYLVYAGWGMTIRIALKRNAPDRIGRRKILCVGLSAWCSDTADIA